MIDKRTESVVYIHRDTAREREREREREKVGERERKTKS